MPIKVTCACGQSFAAKDELAGRTVKCPKCSRPLAIPALAAGRVVPATPPAATPQRPAVSATPAPAPAAAAPASGGLFDEVGIPSAPVGTMPCPGCRTPMAMGAIVCVQCGYNIKLGRRMETMRIGADGQVGSGSVTDMVLARAARTLEEEKEEEKKKVREGLPWWAYLLMLVGLVSFLGLMMALPQQIAILAGGAMLFLAGTALAFYGWLMVVIKAFRDDGPLQGIGTMICGMYQLVYIIINWSDCAGFFFMQLGGSVLQMCGYLMMVYLFDLIRSDKPQAMLLLEHLGTYAEFAMTSFSISLNHSGALRETNIA